MRTIKIKLIGLLATMLLGATASFGQAVYYDADEGGVVIDCTMMPAGTILTESKESTDNQLPSHYETDEANTVYPKLVVAMEDLNSGSSITWDDAVTAAKDYEDELSSNTDWRLPNQRELMLIWVLKDEIEAAADSVGSFQCYLYWSSTVNSSKNSYYGAVCFIEVEGYMNFFVSNYQYCGARAVREISL